MTLLRLVTLAVLAGASTACLTSDDISGGDGGSDGGERVGSGAGVDDDGDGDGDGDGAGSGDGGSTSAPCGDGICAPTEDCASCAADCTCSDPVCGDAVCDASEDCATCEPDCGVCATCGDGACDASEDCATCFEDCGVCACMPDAFEPNGSSPAATNVSLGTDYCMLSVCAGDVDWLEFSVSNGFTAELTFNQAQGDLDLEIYSVATVDYVSGSYSADNDESVTLNGLPAGAYWARIYGKGGDENPDYCFRVDP